MTQDAPRILVVAPSAELYGSDRALLSALPELSAGFDVTLAVPAPGPAIERAETLGVRCLLLPDYAVRRRHLEARNVLPWLVRFLVAAWRLHQIHRRDPFHLIYSNTLAAGLGAALQPAWRVPHVLHVHECPLDPAWVPRVLLAIAARTSDHVICNSHHTRSLVLGFQPRLAAISTVIHNGIDLPVPDAEPATGHDDAFRVCLVGRITTKKGHRVLLEAARLARRDGDRWEIHFFGDALPEQAAFEASLHRQAEDAGVAADVHWHGFVEDAAEKYRGMDVCVVPSVLPEEFSLVCLEGQSMGLPVVATGPGGPSEIVIDGETGFIVPPEDPVALASAIGRLRRDPSLRREMGRKGRERAVATFVREVYAAKVLKVCEEAVALRPPRFAR